MDSLLGQFASGFRRPAAGGLLILLVVAYPFREAAADDNSGASHNSRWSESDQLRQEEVVDAARKRAHRLQREVREQTGGLGSTPPPSPEASQSAARGSTLPQPVVEVTRDPQAKSQPSAEPVRAPGGPTDLISRVKLLSWPSMSGAAGLALAAALAGVLLILARRSKRS